MNIPLYSPECPVVRSDGIAILEQALLDELLPEAAENFPLARFCSRHGCRWEKERKERPCFFCTVQLWEQRVAVMAD